MMSTDTERLDTIKRVDTELRAAELAGTDVQLDQDLARAVVALLLSEASVVGERDALREALLLATAYLSDLPHEPAMKIAAALSPHSEGERGLTLTPHRMCWSRRTDAHPIGDE